MNILIRHKFLTFATISTLGLLLYVAAFLLFFQQKTAPQPSQNSQENLSPTISIQTPEENSPQTKPPILYDKAQSEKLLEKLSVRTQLSPSDIAIKNSLIQSLGGKSAVVHATDKFRIEYVRTADLFQVEILSTPIAQTKQDATNWFVEQGLSLNGVCNLPVQFYLNFDVANSLRGSNIQFGPLAEGC